MLAPEADPDEVLAELDRLDEAVQSRIVPPPSDPMRVARTFVDHLHSNAEGLLLRSHGGDFYRWDGTAWPDVNVRDVKGQIYTFLENACYLDSEGSEKPFAPNRRKVEDVVDALKAVTLIDSAARPPLWTSAKPGKLAAIDVVAMQNGLLHVPSRDLYPHSPRFFNHHSLSFPFVPDAPPPKRWNAFLRELWGDEQSSIDVLQEVFGYVLAGGTEQQKIFLLCGPKRGGKGTIGRVLTGLLGAHNTAAPTLSSMATNFGLSPLIGKPLALISDARLSGKADSKIVVERLLSISGEDSLTIDRKYRDPWTGRLPSRFVIMTNELPRLSDSSGALSSRFILLVLTRSFYGEENPNLTEELLGEASSILNWSLQGLDRLKERGYFQMPASSQEALQQLEDLTSPVAAFLRERCTLGPRAEVEVGELWTAWKHWCEDDNRHPGTKAVFGRDLRAAAPTIKKARSRLEGERVHRYLGLSLADTTLPNIYDHHDQPGQDGAGGHGGHSNLPLYPPQEGWEEA
jgi:putative DNA primase/helicase